MQQINLFCLRIMTQVLLTLPLTIKAYDQGMKSTLFFLFLILGSSGALAQIADGSYKQPCSLYDEDHLDATWSIQSGEWQHTRTAYEDASCQIPWLSYQETYRLSFFKFDKINLIHLKARYMVHSQEVAEALNSIRFCELTTWKPGHWQEVNGLTCQDFAPPQNQEMLYSIIATQDDGFYFGIPTAGFNGKSEGTRHQKLSPLLYEIF